jgi:formate dehydrogenase subunit gamma
VNRVPRFDRTERLVHWCNATLFFVLLFTGFSLYAGPLQTLVGRRVLMKTIHVYAGLALPLPVLIGIALRSGRRLRADLGTLNRWDRRDRVWWSRRRRATARLGKFNPGQKLNAAFIGAAIPVMLGTGIIMRWFEPFPLEWRTGATFVHDWFAIGVLLSVIGHVAFAFADREALRSITRGWVSAGWARANRPRWYDEVQAESGAGASGEQAEVRRPVGDVVGGA